MLDKIENISQNAPYSGGNNPKQNSDKNFYREFEQRMSAQDKIKLSPAAYYLTRINWQIKDLNYKTSDKVSIAFIANNLEFETEVDFLLFYNEKRQKFIISRLLEEDGGKKYSFFISVKKKAVVINEDAEVSQLNAISGMFDKALLLEIIEYEYKPESVFIEELLTGMKQNLEKEFDYVVSTLFTLLYKLKNYKIIDNYKFEEDKEEAFIIEKIMMQPQ
ncbi:MAG TPA: hypothetical protein VHP30_04335 [Ignavibacteriales bacterium]|nr:hypothetical protein [Ignavibacteriales bacterium]